MRTAVTVLVVVMALSGCEKDEPPPPAFPDSGVTCMSTADQSQIQSWLADAGPEAGPLDDPGLLAALACGRVPECLDPLYQGQIDAGYQCVDDCMGPTAAGSLTAGCRNCYIVNGLLCAGYACLTVCVGSNAACEPCFQEQCADALYHCLGL